MMCAGCTSPQIFQGQNPCKAPIAQWIERLPPKVIRRRHNQALGGSPYAYACIALDSHLKVRPAYVEPLIVGTNA